MTTIPLFPLKSVLFPDGILSLRIFEPRYLDMVSECMRSDSCFGVCLIRNGNEAGKAAECFDVGTFARIVDWEQRNDGLLGITVKGESRFRILEKHVRKNQLLEGKVEFIDDDENELPVEHQLLSDLLRQIVEKFELSYKSEHEKYLDAGWVGCRLAELLPLELSDKQELLEIDNPLYRLEQLQLALENINQDQFAE
jgi:hypothetical protein